MAWKEQFENAMGDMSIHERVDNLVNLLKSYSTETGSVILSLETIGKFKALIHTHLDAVAQGKGCEEYREQVH